MLAGVHEQYQGPNKTTIQETLQRFPRTAVTREFNKDVIAPQNLVPRLRNLCQHIWDKDLTAAVSFKFSVADVFNGRWRPFIESATAWLRDSGYANKTIIVIWHEPEDDVPKSFANAEQFVMYFNQVHNWIKGIDTSVLTCHAAMGYRYADTHKGTQVVPIDINDDTAKVWGLTKADIKAIDAYSGRSFPLATTLPELTGFKRWLTYTVGDNPYAVTERGWMADTPEEYARREQTVRREADWLKNDPVGQRCILYILWLTEGTENDPSLKPDSKMASAVNYLLEQVTASLTEPEEPQQPSEPANDTIECPLCHGSSRVSNNTTYVIVKTG